MLVFIYLFLMPLASLENRDKNIMCVIKEEGEEIRCAPPY